MTLTPPTRKRTRSCEEEEFLPLSKKINNLHINNWGKVDSPQDHILKWANGSNDELVNFYSPGGAQETDSRNTTSHFEGVGENCTYNETDLIQHITAYKGSGYTNESSTNGESSNCDGGRSNWSPVYSPDLDINENPYYYESNKLLFDLYLQRLQRNGY